MIECPIGHSIRFFFEKSKHFGGELVEKDTGFKRSKFE